MGRFRFREAKRGSQRWIQVLVNHRPELLDERLTPLVEGPIEWLSPLASDEYAEYRDQSVLELLGLTTSSVALGEFWPSGGPQWDAVGCASDGAVILVEAKAHIPELVSGPSQAKDPASLELISRSLHATAEWLSAKPKVPWNGPFYQLANRLAHLFFLQELNGVPAHLVFIYFYGDTEMNGPESPDEWQGAIQVANQLLGLSRRTEVFIDAFVDVSELRSS